MGKVNPKIDLVFKKLFGSEKNKDILLPLINATYPDYQQIIELKLKILIMYQIMLRANFLSWTSRQKTKTAIFTI